MGLTDEDRNNLVKYRLNKSEEVFHEALDVANLSHWNLTVNRLYYSVFHICSALLLNSGEVAKTHNGIIRLTLKNYVITGKLNKEEGSLISTLFNMRNTGDYDDMFDYNESQVIPLIEPTRNLLCKIKKLIDID